MFLHTKSFSKLTKIKFGSLGMAGVMLFAGLGIATVVSNVPGVTQKAQAASAGKYLGSARIYKIPGNVYGSAWGCATVRNSYYGKVADVRIFYTLTSSKNTWVASAYLRISRNVNGYKTFVSYSSSNSWWDGNSMTLSSTASINLGDRLEGGIGNSQLFTKVDPAQLPAC